ncbi:MAG: metallophosphoesterase [Xenococcaceae cyanobacterium MO_188.B32]|nr:metallophosphoesterase [Xenococcaceae cyanobacterium MO_188.B32]
MYILHLSDLHFGTQQDANRWYGQLADDLRGLLSQLESNQSPHLDALIISGDIANQSLPEEYEVAERFINLLLPEFGLQRHQIAIVPGNHDLNWKLSKKAYEIKERESYDGSLDDEDILKNDIIVDGNFVLVPKQQQYEERFKHFSNFYENVIGRPYPRQYRQQYELRHFPEQSLLILGLNSAWKLNHHENYRSRASINPDALNNALGEINQTPSYRDSKLKIAVWHHPLDSPDEDRIKDRGFMERLSVNNFRLGFHGHIHRANARDYNYIKTCS